MTIKDLKQLTKHYPTEAKIKFAGSDIHDDAYTVELKFDSEEGWIALISFKDSQKHID